MSAYLSEITTKSYLLDLAGILGHFPSINNRRLPDLEVNSLVSTSFYSAGTKKPFRQGLVKMVWHIVVRASFKKPHSSRKLPHYKSG